jgi:hypothetical protein
MPSKMLTAFNRSFTTLAAAIRASSAVEAGRRPHKGDLEALGIDLAAFRNITR